MSRVERIGDATLYLGKMEDILPGLGGGFNVLTDPPYGINAARDRNSQQWGWKDYPSSGWDRERPPAASIKLITDAASNAIIWGGNYFSDLLPASGKWLIWDKCQTDFSLADCELAWCSFDGAVRRFNYPRSKALQDGKEHPTQKPVALMDWCIEQLPKGRGTILDCYLGSGTTGVSAAKAGRAFVGIEADQHFFDVSCRRIEQAYKQADLFIAPPAKPVQPSMFNPEAA